MWTISLASAKEAKKAMRAKKATKDERSERGIFLKNGRFLAEIILKDGHFL